MAKKRSTLVLVIVGVAVFVVLLFAGGLVWFFTSALERSPVDEATAEARIQELLDRFPGVTPVFAMGPNGPVLNRQLPPKPATGQLRRMQMLGWDRNVGTLTAGKWADIVAVPGDPIADIKTMEKTVFVMKNGVVFKTPGATPAM